MLTYKELYAQNLPAIKGWTEGKLIQFACINDSIWEDFSADSLPAFDSKLYKWRIKPEPKYRPWTIDEVPVGGVVRANCGSVYVITSKNTENNIVILGAYKDIPYSTKALFDCFTYIKDGNNIVLPCGVLEG